MHNVRDPVELVAAVRHGDTSDQGLAIDPVYRNGLSTPPTPPDDLNYDNTTYFFCTLTCAGEFARHPERFAQPSP